MGPFRLVHQEARRRALQVFCTAVGSKRLGTLT